MYGTVAVLFVVLVLGFIYRERVRWLFPSSSIGWPSPFFLTACSFLFLTQVMLLVQRRTSSGLPKYTPIETKAVY